jgi:hypothetical protein
MVVAKASVFPIVNQIIKVLFASEDRRLTSWIDRMCRRNKEAYRGELPNAAQLQGFIFNGVFYRPSDVTGPISGRKALHASLWSEMETLEKDKKIVDTERDFVRQTLYALMDPCSTDQDFRDALPECLIDTLPQLKRLSRTREPAFTIEGNARAIRQYEKMLPKIEVYAAARMIY